MIRNLEKERVRDLRWKLTIASKIPSSPSLITHLVLPCSLTLPELSCLLTLSTLVLSLLLTSISSPQKSHKTIANRNITHIEPSFLFQPVPLPHSSNLLDYFIPFRKPSWPIHGWVKPIKKRIQLELRSLVLPCPNSSYFLKPHSFLIPSVERGREDGEREEEEREREREREKRGTNGRWFKNDYFEPIIDCMSCWRYSS